MRSTFCILLVLFSFASCTKKKIPQNDSLLGLAYYPLTQGKFIVYDVDSIVYTDLPRDSVHYKYRIKERVADAFTDNQGQEAIRLERFIKKFDPNKSYDSIPWTVKEVWMVNATKKSIQVSEREVRYTKLIFPIQLKASWNGNAHNTIGEWDYTYDYIDKNETINGVSLEKVLFVNQKDFKTFISWQKYSEKYAKDIGLVYREITDIYSNTVVPGVAVENRIENGLIYRQALVSYGNE